MKSRVLLILAVLALAALACEFSFGFGDNASSSSDPNVLFEDDFSNVDSGWDRSTYTGLGLTDYENGGYRIQVIAENSYVFANPSRNFSDVSITVEATKIGGDDDNEFGVICRQANLENFYAATISSDGFYSFVALKDDSLQFLNMENMLPAPAINQGDATNTIRLDCIGSKLTLYVNGEFVGETVDDSLSSGDVGLYAGTFSIPGTDILFDNMVVREP